MGQHVAHRASDAVAIKPIYHCVCHGFFMIGEKWVMDMTISTEHKATGTPAGTRGRTSALKMVDFEDGVAETRNSFYHFVSE